MAGVKGASPRSLAKNNPVQALAESVTPDLSTIARPSPQISTPIPAPPPEREVAAEEPDPMDMLQSMAAPQAAADTEVDPMDQLQALASGPSEDAMVKEASEGDRARSPLARFNVSELGTRVKTSFATTDYETRKVLEAKFGDNAVRQVKDRWQVKRGDRWTNYDPTGLELADVADFARDAAVEVGALPAEIPAAWAAAGATGSIAGIPAAPALLAAGRAVGSLTGETFADYLATSLGVPQDPEKSILAQRGTQAGLRTLFGAGADFVAKKTAIFATNRLAGKLTKGAKYLAETPEQEIVMAAGAAKETMDSVKHLNDAGLVTAIPGGDGAILSPAQANTANQVALKSAQRAASSPEYQTFLAKQGEMLASAWTKITGAASDLETRVLSRVVEGAKPSVNKSASVAERAYGAIIGQWRDRAIKEGGEQHLAATGFTGGLDETARLIGFKEGKNGQILWGTMDRPDAETVANNLGISEEQAGHLLKNMIRYRDATATGNGMLTAKEMDRLYQELARRTDDAFTGDKSGSYKKAMMNLRNGIRDDFTTGIRNIFSPEDQAKYSHAMDSFSKVKDAADELTSLFGREQVGSKAMAAHIFGGGITSLDKVKALKSILEKESPEAWQEVVGSWTGELVRKHGIRSDEGKLTGGMNWRALQKELEGMPEVLGEVFGPNNAKSMLHLANLGGQIQEAAAKTGTMSDDMAAKLGLALSQAARGWHHAPKAALNILSAITGGEGRAVAAQLTRGGREKILKRVAARNRQAVGDWLDKAMASSVVNTGVRAGAQSIGREAGYSATNPEE